jgi:hypothetical protein
MYAHILYTEEVLIFYQKSAKIFLHNSRLEARNLRREQKPVALATGHKLRTAYESAPCLRLNEFFTADAKAFVAFARETLQPHSPIRISRAGLHKNVVHQLRLRVRSKYATTAGCYVGTHFPLTSYSIGRSKFMSLTRKRTPATFWTIITGGSEAMNRIISPGNISAGNGYPPKQCRAG